MTSHLVVLAGLLFAAPAEASGDLDQSSTFDGTGNFDEVFVNGPTPQRLAQSFTAGVNGTLTSVGVGISQTSSPTNLTIEIFDSTGNSPTGSSHAVHTLTGADLAAVTAGQAMVTVAFATPTSVTAGSTYAIVASTTDLLPAKFNWYWGSTYSRGAAAYDDGVSIGWNTLNYDFTFATYVIADPTPEQTGSQSPAPVLQQFGKTGPESCASTAPESLNWSGVARSGWGESWAQWMNGGTGGFVCTRTLTYSTSLNRWTVD